MPDHRFIAGITDQGKPRAAKGGFPYSGHLSLGEQRERAEYRESGTSWHGVTYQARKRRAG